MIGQGTDGGRVRQQSSSASWRDAGGRLHQPMSAIALGAIAACRLSRVDHSRQDIPRLALDVVAAHGVGGTWARFNRRLRGEEHHGVFDGLIAGNPASWHQHWRWSRRSSSAACQLHPAEVIACSSIARDQSDEATGLDVTSTAKKLICTAAAKEMSGCLVPAS